MWGLGLIGFTVWGFSTVALNFRVALALAGVANDAPRQT